MALYSIDRSTKCFHIVCLRFVTKLEHTKQETVIFVGIYDLMKTAQNHTFYINFSFVWMQKFTLFLLVVWYFFQQFCLWLFETKLYIMKQMKARWGNKIQYGKFLNALASKYGPKFVIQQKKNFRFDWMLCYTS